MTTIPVAYRTGSTIDGTYKLQQIVLGKEGARDFSGEISGTTFWNSPDLDTQWVIYKAFSGATQPTQISGVTANVGFWGTKNAVNPLSHQSFVDLMNATIRKDSATKFNTPLSAVTFLSDDTSLYYSNFQLFDGSIHLDGSSCVTTNLTGNAPGTGIFDYACWVFADDLSSTQGIFSTRSGNTSDGFDLDINTSGNLVVSWNGTNLMTTSNSITPKKWHHVGVIRSGATWFTMIDGLTGATANNAQNFTSTNLSIGSSAQGNNKFRGKISNFRYAQELIQLINVANKKGFLSLTTGTTFLCNTFNSDMYLVDESPNSYVISEVGSPTSDFFNPFSVNRTGLKLHLDAGIDVSYSGSGSSWYDISGNNNHGTLSGNTTFSGDTIVFDGTNSSITFNTLTGLTTGDTEYTISVWVQLDELKTQGLVGYGNNAVTKSSNNFKLTSTGITSDWTNYEYSEAFTLETGSTWYNIVTNYEGITRRIFVNGDSITCPGPVATSLNVTDFTNFKIGVTNDNEWLKGKISQVLVYNRGLSEGEIHYNYIMSKNRYQ